MSILETIRSHADLVALDPAQRSQLCGEIRQFLVDHVSQTGGHLSANLGVVELTVAIETVLDTRTDRLIFDVGHQSYVHKILTGRQAEFGTLRQYGGIAGFPKPSESDCDAFVAGHASSSVSIAMGMARARTLTGQNYRVAVVLGDGASTGGMAYEGLNDASVSGEPIVVILNDNTLSIDSVVGGLASHLSKLRTKEKYLGMKKRYKDALKKIPGGKNIYHITRKIKNSLRRMLIPTTVFESMGFDYLGPVDGHNTESLIYLLQTAVDMKRPVVLHVTTKKGKGYAPAEEHPKLFHGVGKFDPVTGQVPSKSGETFSDVFGKTMVSLASSNEKICAITAAMPGGTGLLEYKKQFPKRLYDVGIAEEHAVSMAGGLAKQGAIPVFAVYSTFLQRAFDPILQDVAILGLHVVFAVDRAGLVGEDGETHHGVFDVGFLRQIPNMTVLCPASLAELSEMLDYAVNRCTGPVAVRYPRGGNRSYIGSAFSGSTDTVCCHESGTDAAIVVYGTMLQNATDAAQILRSAGIRVSVIRLLCVDPLPITQITAALGEIPCVLIAEEVMHNSGIYPELAAALKKDMPSRNVLCADLGEQYVPHGSVEQLYRHCGLDGRSLACAIQEALKSES